MSRAAVRIALPVGDPNGIGPEISLKTVAAYAGRDDVQITLFGPQAVLQRAASHLGLADLLSNCAVVSTGGGGQRLCSGEGMRGGRFCYGRCR